MKRMIYDTVCKMWNETDNPSSPDSKKESQLYVAILREDYGKIIRWI